MKEIVEPLESSNLFRLERWRKFITSDEWREFMGLLNDRRDYLKDQAFIQIGAGNFEKAKDFHARAAELLAIQRLASCQTKKLEEEKDGI